jgi:hypothetical protein
MGAGRSERACASPDGHLPFLEVSLHQARRHAGCAVYCLGVAYYLTYAPGGAGFFGVPDPAVGARVVFDAERLFAARERRLGRPVTRELRGDEGLVVLEDPMEALTWPCRLWRVDDLEGAVRLQPSNRWLRCKAVTVCEELPGWLVLGPRGDGVVEVIEQARSLTSGQVNAIAAMGGDDERGLYRAAWDRWRRTRQSGSPVAALGLSLWFALWRRRRGEPARRWSDGTRRMRLRSSPILLGCRQATRPQRPRWPLGHPTS